MTKATQAIHTLLLSCGLLVAALGDMSRATAGETGPKAGSVTQGAQTWSENCARCHNLRAPSEFRDDLWKPIVTHMRVRAGLTGQQQRDVLAFLQASNNPQPTGVSTSPSLDSAAGSGLSGAEIYGRTCIACHGGDGSGSLPGVPDLTAADGPLMKPDDVLLRNITEGFQTPGSPMAMPPKGGNPDLGSADIRAVLTYLRERFGN